MAPLPLLSIVLALAALTCSVMASPIPDEAGRDASASAPSNFLDCATAVGQGNGFNNCSIPSAPSGSMPTMPSMPSMPSAPSASQVPSMPSISQGVDCATAVGQGNGFNNCTNIITPPSGLFGSDQKE